MVPFAYNSGLREIVTVVKIPQSQIPNPKSLRPPQFGLRTLLLLVTACGVVLAFVRLEWLSPIAIGVLLFLSASIVCHVAGNVIGTRLREIGDHSDRSRLDDPVGRLRPRPHDFAPATRLGQRQSLGWTIVVASSVGVTSGAIGGGLWTFLASRGHIGLLNIAVGMAAFAVLGGFAAFAIVAFTQVLFGAIWQAMKAPQPSATEPGMEQRSM
jgi:hypothetical protein